MKGLKLYFSIDLLLPWSFGPGRGWGFDWFDIGPLTVWRNTPKPKVVDPHSYLIDAVRRAIIESWNDAVADIMKDYR